MRGGNGLTTKAPRGRRRGIFTEANEGRRSLHPMSKREEWPQKNTKNTKVGPEGKDQPQMARISQKGEGKWVSVEVGWWVGI